MKLLLECSLLILPALLFKLWRDRNGVRHPDPEGVRNVAYIMFLSVTVVRFGALYFEIIPFAETVSEVLWWYGKAFAVAVTGYGLFFQYLINFILTKHSGWTLRYRIGYSFIRLNPDAIPDKWFVKFGIHWGVRLGLYLGLFVMSVWWFAL